jgi:NADH-quinone oxidoreductase subunit L
MTAVMIPSYYVWMVFIVPFVGALVAPLTGKTRARDYIAVLFALVSALFTLLLLLPILEGKTISLYNSLIPTSVPWIPELGVNVGVLSDPYTIIISSLVAWISFLVMVYSLDYMKGDSGLTRYWFFMNFFIGSMQLIVLSDNLLTLFIGFEGVGLCSYALIGYYYHDEKENWVGTPGYKVLGEEQAYPPSHAGMKAFFMTRVGDIAMLAGLLILFIYAGTFNFQQLLSSPNWATELAKNDLLVPAALLIFGGAVGKSAQFPLVEWLPDAMTGPAPVSALIHAATMVNAGVVLVARIGPVFYFALLANPSLIQPFFITVAWIGAFTAFLAATQATVGFELKKILAYSTVSQIGYMMLALGLAGLSTSFAQGLSAGLFQLMSHAVFKAALFLMAGALIHSAHSKYINEMGGMKDRLKLTFAVFLIAVASLSGIPPLSGFWAKDAVLGIAWSSGQFGLFIVGSVTAGITAFYAFRMLGIVFFGQKSPHLTEVEAGGHPLHEAGPLSWVPYTILASGTVVLGILGFFDIEGFLDSAANTYLRSLLPAGSGAVLSGASLSFNLTAAGITLALVLVGLLIASQLYFLRQGSADRIIASSAFLRGLHTFLENRWYINAVYYKVFVDAPLAAATWTHTHFEWGVLQRVNTGAEALAKDLSAGGGWLDTSVIDRLANRIADGGQAISRTARKIQTGIVENYALVLILGLLVMLLLFILLTGLYTLL